MNLLCDKCMMQYDTKDGYTTCIVNAASDNKEVITVCCECWEFMDGSLSTYLKFVDRQLEEPL